MSYTQIINNKVLNDISLSGPFELCEKEIDSKVPSSIIGNFLLGYCHNHNDLFNVLYVGHSEDLNTRLKKHLGDFSLFKFKRVRSLHAAYLNVCKFYHIFTEESFIINDRHPVAPLGSDWMCPLCGMNGRG